MIVKYVFSSPFSKRNRPRRAHQRGVWSTFSKERRTGGFIKEDFKKKREVRS
jgi:hypothetical protein